MSGEAHGSLTARRLFVAGSTGATGRTLLRLLPPGVDCVAHRRPRPEREGAGAGAGAGTVRTVTLDLGDAAALAAAMAGRTTVIQLIGTMKKRFSSGDTYESSDIQTTRQLVAAAQQVGADHVILLSSVGAGSPSGAYLQAKAEAERIVIASGLASGLTSGIVYTILRPSAFIGEEHHVPFFVEPICRWIGLDRYRPIRLEQLAAAILQVALDRGPAGVLEGRGLWEVVDRAVARQADQGSR